MNNTTALKKIKEQKETYECHYSEMIEEQKLAVYVNKTETYSGEIISAYIGLEDENGSAVTGYDMAVEF